MPRLLDDWLSSYLEYTDDTESPEKFHLWTGLTMLSAAMKRQVWLRVHRSTIYPNIYVILVAESGKQRKSAAVDFGIDIIQAGVKDLLMIPDATTAEGIVKYVHKHTLIGPKTNRLNVDGHLLIYADELATLFSHDKNRASRMATLLTRCYMCPPIYSHNTATEDMIHMTNPYITLIAATAPENLKVIPEDAAVGGLLGRLIIVSAKNKRHVKSMWSEEDGKVQQLRSALVNDIKHISQLTGSLTATPDAKFLFDKWYDRLQQKDVEDKRIDGFLSRCHDTAVKIAMLLSLSVSDNKVVEEKHMAGGIAFIEEQLPEIKRTINWTGQSVYEVSRNKVIDIVRRKGGLIKRTELIKVAGLRIDEFEAMILTLQAENTLTKNEVPKLGIVYKLNTDELEAKQP